MPSIPSSKPETQAVRTAYQQAVAEMRPGWQALALILAGLVLGTVVPAIALCGVLNASGIVWAVTLTTLALGIASWVYGWQLSCNRGDDPRVFDLQLGGTLITTAALLWGSIALQTGPVAERMFAFWPTVGIAMAAVVVNGVMTHRRAMRIVRRAAQDCGDGVDGNVA